MQHNGWWSTWSQLVESLDPFGEKNALKVMGLQKGASQEEIRSKYRELTKMYHPDKVQGTQVRDEFVERVTQIMILLSCSCDDFTDFYSRRKRKKLMKSLSRFSKLMRNLVH